VVQSICWRDSAVWGLLVLASGASCRPGPTELGRCAGELPVQVDQSAGLRFTWEPADCRVNSLAVVEGQATRWYIVSGERYRNQIASDVEYGQVPAGAVGLEHPGDALWKGNRYTLLLGRIDEAGSEVTAARIDFVKQ